MDKPLPNDISSSELKGKLLNNSSVTLLDVREELEYHTFNIGGDNIPLSNLMNNIENLKYNKDAEIVVICQRGIRSETARKLMADAGFTNVKNLTGGLIEYRKNSI